MKIYKKIANILVYALIFLCSFFSIALLFGILGYVGSKGIKRINWSFISSVTSVLNGTVGIADLLLLVFRFKCDTLVYMVFLPIQITEQR